MKLDINAPIIPFEGLGGIKLYSKIDDLRELLTLDDTTCYIGTNQIHYTIQGKIGLVFHSKNGKLMIISAEPGYKGKLFGKIGLGMLEEDFLKLCPNFIYEDFEEIWIDDKNCVSIVTDAGTGEIIQINLFVPESKLIDFDEGNW